MTSEPTSVDTSLDDLLNRHFAGRVVRKDLTKLVKEGANVPVYVLEYLLGTYCATNDEEVIQEGLKTVKRILAENYVRPDEAEKVKSIIRERGSLKIIDKVTVSLNERRDVYEALLSNLGVRGVEVSSATVNSMRNCWSAASGRSSPSNTSMKKASGDRRSSSGTSNRFRCPTWISRNCSGDAEPSRRRNGSMCSCVQPASSPPTSMNG
jgi:hypothetical protein